MTELASLPEPDVLRVCGDWHGATRWAKCQITDAGLVGTLGEKRTAILVVGDFGYWVDNEFTEEFLSTVSREAGEWGIDLYFLDGNHEDHTRIAALDQTRPAALPDHPGITYLPRGARWSWWGKTFMAVGGAPSVDKHHRVEGRDWWPGEELTDEQVQHCTREGRVDVVLAHDCPTGVDIPRVGDGIAFTPSTWWPDEAIRRSNAHRERMARIADAVSPAMWVHGHYHVAYARQRGPTAVRGLDCNGSNWADHTLTLTREYFG